MRGRSLRRRGRGWVGWRGIRRRVSMEETLYIPPPLSISPFCVR
jgi:hypothetical protein